jgi:4-amino-4-deoxy-L-arabinose transferase-like glycosyltransferase
MRLSGDYFRPTINGRLYYDKPLGSYWLVLAAGWLTGSHDERAARLPSAVSGLVGVGLLMVIARRLYGGHTAVLAGLILATSFAYVDFARCASADAETVAGVLAALAIAIQPARRPGVWLVGLWLVMALTSLTKGLLGFALPLLVLVTDSAVTPLPGEGGDGSGRMRAILRRNGWLLSRWSAVGAALAVAVYLAPFAASGDVAERGLALVVRENLQRFFAPHNHRGPVYLYAYVILGLMAPWSVFLPAALIQAGAGFRNGSRPTADRFALVYFGTTFLFFTLSASRRSYYLLPVLPAGALLVARLLTTPADTLSAVARRGLWLGFAVLTVGVVTAGALLLPTTWLLPTVWADLPAAPASTAFALGWLGCLLLIARSWRSGRAGEAVFACGVVVTLALAYLFLAGLPTVEPFRGERAFAAEVRRLVGPDTKALAFHRTREPVYYIGAPHPITEYDSPAELRAAIGAGRVSWVVLRRRDLDGLGLPFRVAAEETTFPWADAAVRSEKMLLLRVEPDE